MSTKAKCVKLNEIRHGKTFYVVHALGHGSYMHKVFCLGKPYRSAYGSRNSMFVRCISYMLYKGEFSVGYRDFFSINDLNIVPNHYNHHRCFTSKKAAQRYVEHCKRNRITFHGSI